MGVCRPFLTNLEANATTYVLVVKTGFVVLRQKSKTNQFHTGVILKDKVKVILK